LASSELTPGARSPSASEWCRVFLLSPAHCGGKRAGLLVRPEARFDLAERVRSPQGAPLGEVFSFLSGLYFRGKIAYANAFAAPPEGVEGALVITAGRGLVPPSTPFTLADLAFFATVPIDLREPRYRTPLESSVRALADRLPDHAEVVLLGSISSSKYVELLLDILGDRLCFPERFVGMGDMQRGSVMLKASSEGCPLRYVRAAGAVRSRAGRSAPRGRRRTASRVRPNPAAGSP
jgi:hypothetical protein